MNVLHNAQKVLSSFERHLKSLVWVDFLSRRRRQQRHGGWIAIVLYCNEQIISIVSQICSRGKVKVLLFTLTLAVFLKSSIHPVGIKLLLGIPSPCPCVIFTESLNIRLFN